MKYGFIATTVSGQVVPQCMMCFENLSSDALRPSLLQGHLQINALAFEENLGLYFKARQTLKKRKIKIASNECFCQSSSAEVVEVTFEIAHMITKKKKTHNRSCWKHSTLCWVSEQQKARKDFSCWFCTEIRIDQLTKDIACQVLKDTRITVFAIQCDETTDVDQLAQLLIYDVRFLRPSSVEEEMLLCRPLETITKAEGAFQVVATFFDNSGMKWEKLVGICTDGAPAMLGSRSGLFARINQKSPLCLWISLCDPWGSGHRHAFFCSERQACNNYIRAVDLVKTSSVLCDMLCKYTDSNHGNLLFHTSVQCLSKGNSLC